MNRRTLIVGTTIGIASLPWRRVAYAAQGATPTAGRLDSGTIPEPVTLADGLTLIDYRLGVAYGSLDSTPMLFGELRNTLDGIFQLPNVLITFLDKDGNILGEESANGIVPFIEPTSTRPISAEFYDFNPLVDEYDTVSFSIDNEWPPTYDSYAPLPVTLENETRRDRSWTGKAVVTNDTGAPIKNINAVAIFRDSRKRYAGYTWGALSSTLATAKKATIKLDVGVNSIVPYDPFQFLDDERYSVDVEAWHSLN